MAEQKKALEEQKERTKEEMEKALRT